MTQLEPSRAGPLAHAGPCDGQTRSANASVTLPGQLKVQFALYRGPDTLPQQSITLSDLSSLEDRQIRGTVRDAFDGFSLAKVLLRPKG